MRRKCWQWVLCECSGTRSNVWWLQTLERLILCRHQCYSTVARRGLNGSQNPCNITTEEVTCSFLHPISAFSSFILFICHHNATFALCEPPHCDWRLWLVGTSDEVKAIEPTAWSRRKCWHRAARSGSKCQPRVNHCINKNFNQFCK